MKAVILAAGGGTRFKRSFPKTLSVLPDGEQILGRQIRIMRKYGIREIYVVVGFKKDLIMETFPDVFYVYNPLYHLTNTSKSLRMAIKNLSGEILWVNGDVVFEEMALKKIISVAGNVVGVNNAHCGEEEVKYRIDEQSHICEISKEVQHADGEAIGINKIAPETLPMFIDALQTCADTDYFEKAVELIIQKGASFKPVDISEFKCIEVDFEEDWQKTLDLFGHGS